MKYLITLLLLIGVAYGQTPTYTPMRSFYEFKGIKMDSLFILPTFADTTSANSGRIKNIPGSVIIVGTDLYVRNNNTWTQISKNAFNANLTATGDRLHEMGFADFGIQNIDRLLLWSQSDDYLASTYIDQYPDKINITSRTDTDTMSLLLEGGNGGRGRFIGNDGYSLWVPPTIHTQNDTIATRAYSRSVGGGSSADSNFAKNDLTATGDRYHNFVGYDLDIDSVYKITLSSTRPTIESYVELNGTTGKFGASKNTGEFTGLLYSTTSNRISLHNNNNTAYLSKNNFGSDTLALYSNLLPKIDSLRRSNDSVFAYKNNAWVYQYKLPAAVADGPDRIKGTALGNVDANMDNLDLTIREANKIELKTFNNEAILKMEGKRIDLGDINSSNNGTLLSIIDGSGIILAGYASLADGLYLDLSNGEYIFGDVNNGKPQIFIQKADTSIELNANKIRINAATNSPMGSGTFVSGVATINNTSVTANSKIFISYTNCVNCGTPYIDSKTAGTSFVVKSNNGSDDSNFDYLIIN